MSENKMQGASLPLVETDWLAEQLDNPNLRILDCNVMYRDSDDGNRREYFSPGLKPFGHTAGCPIP